MTLLDGMNNALKYIEDNLDGDIDYAAVAKAACCSPYHFQRFFVSVTDIPLSEYIRRRRLTLAAFELQNTDRKVIDIAFKYGYQSSDAFTRAFVTLHGITPSKAREQGAVLKAYPCITFTLSIKGVVALNYRIEEKKAIRVVGVKEWFSIAAQNQLNKIPEMWHRVNTDGTGDKIYSLIDSQPGCLGICADMYNDGFDYWIAASTSKKCPPDLTEMEIPAATWAIFEVTGAMPNAIQDVWGRIFSEWFPSSGYEHAKTAELEVYLDGDTDSPDYKSEIWIPVIKK